jgi:hypothetical protein
MHLHDCVSFLSDGNPSPGDDTLCHGDERLPIELNWLLIKAKHKGFLASEPLYGRGLNESESSLELQIDSLIR